MTDDELLNLIPPKIREGLSDQLLTWSSVLRELAALARANGDARMMRESAQVLKSAMADYDEWAKSSPPDTFAGSYHRDRIAFAILMQLWFPSEVTK